MASEVILNMMTSAGRLKYNEIQKLALKLSSVEFSELFLLPILVGQDIYKGTIEQDPSAMGRTMSFTLADINKQEHVETPDPTGLRRAIYPLIRQPYSKNKFGIFDIGRDDDNDIVMSDYSISRHHARITLENGKLLLTDIGSKNGTFINDKKIPFNMPHEFTIGNVLGFGRFQFSVVSPTVLHVQLRNIGKAG